MGALDDTVLSNVRSAVSLYGGRVYLSSHVTSDTTLSPNNCWGGVVDNEGAGGTVTVTLPPADPGMEISFSAQAAQIIRIQPSPAVAGPPARANNLISAYGAVAGDYIYCSAAIDQFVTLICVVADVWLVAAAIGTWNDV